MRRLPSSSFSFVVFVVATLISFASLVSAKTINVPGDFSTIQAALNAASEGDTIAVAAGSYFESLTVTKSVSLEGAGKESTVLDGSAGRSRQLPTVLIRGSKSVTIKGFAIQGGRRGIAVEQSADVTIENNKIQRNARQGILVNENSQVHIRNNEIIENINDTGNFVMRSIQVFGPTAQATLVANTIANNTGFGLVVSFGARAQLEGNRIANNGYAGVISIDEGYVEMNGDTIEAIRPGAAAPGAAASNGQGIVVDLYSAFVLKNVTIRNNPGDGLALSAHSIVDLSETTVNNNAGCGIRFDQNSEVNLGAQTSLEANAGGSICAKVPTLAAGGKRTLTFNISAPGEIRILVSSLASATALTLKLFAPGQATPLSEKSGPSPLSLTTSVLAPTSGRWRVELENTSQSAVPVVLSVRQPLFDGTCDGILQDFSIAVVKEPNIRDVSADECQMMYSALKTLPLAWRSKVAQILKRAQDPEAAGRAQSAFIQIYGDQTRNFFMRVVFHEVAHVAHFKLFNPQQFSEWSQLHRAGGNDMENYIGTGTENPNFLYGQTNEFEDFATVTEEYTVDSIGSLGIARERAAKGKPVLLDKFRFLVQLLKDETGGPGVYIYRSIVRPTSRGALRGVVQRAIVPLDREGLPAIPTEIEWEDF